MEGLRFAGDEIGYDLKKDLDNDLRHLIRKPRVGYSFGRDFMNVEPENSEPGYTLTGRYQPSVAYGL